MKMERVVLQKKLCELEDAEAYFERLSGIDPNHVPEKYGDGISRARDLIRDNLKIALVYKCEEIAAISENEVQLKCGEKYTGDMPPRILKDSQLVVNYLISLCGYTELTEKTDDIMAEYFLDAWGSAYVECAQSWLGKQILEEAKQEGMSRTHLWSPGQHKFKLQNQTTLFRILKPEEIGCTLTKNYMMIPIKSVSGMMGIVKEGTRDLLLPCDFCSRGADCPASKRGCAEI